MEIKVHTRDLLNVTALASSYLTKNGKTEPRKSEFLGNVRALRQAMWVNSSKICKNCQHPRFEHTLERYSSKAICPGHAIFEDLG